jgi:flagella basal body P-ring formation protein FlgA
VTAALLLCFRCAAPDGRAAETADGPLLQVRDRVRVETDAVCVADLIVNTSDLDPELAAVQVLTAPDPGDSRTVRLIDVAYALQAVPDLLDARLSGPEFLVLERRADSARLRRLKHDIVTELRGREPWSQWQIDVTFEGLDERELLRAPDYSGVRIRVIDSRTLLGCVPLEVVLTDSDGVDVFRSRVSPAVLREVRAVTLIDRRERGTVLRAADLGLTPVWIGDDALRYVTDRDACVGRELSRALRAGELLRQEHLLWPVCVRRGDVVWVSCSRGPLQVQLAATALQEGRRGEWIRVRNPSSDREVRVLLTGGKAAELPAPEPRDHRVAELN